MPYLAADLGCPYLQIIILCQHLALFQKDKSLLLPLLHQFYESQSIQDLKFKLHIQYFSI